MTDLTLETKEQLLLRLDQIHTIIAGTFGLTIYDNMAIMAAKTLASGETSEEFEVRFCGK